jgi:hypothetical protein
MGTSKPGRVAMLDQPPEQMLGHGIEDLLHRQPALRGAGFAEALTYLPEARRWDAAVQTDQARKVVMVLAPDGTVAPRPVTVGPLVDGLRVIRTGLKLRDKVVINGGQGTMPGTRVQARLGRIAPAQAAAAPPVAVPLNGEASFSGR